jgi:hypothetical protein
MSGFLTLICFRHYSGNKSRSFQLSTLCNLREKSARKSAGRALLQLRNGKVTTMKTRTAAFALALCLLSSLSFADSATDAPLTVSDPYAAAVQPNSSAGSSSVGLSAAQSLNNKKKTKKCATQQAAKSKDKKQHQDVQPYGALQSQTDMWPSM